METIFTKDAMPTPRKKIVFRLSGHYGGTIHFGFYVPDYSDHYYTRGPKFIEYSPHAINNIAGIYIPAMVELFIEVES